MGADDSADVDADADTSAETKIPTSTSQEDDPKSLLKAASDPPLAHTSESPREHKPDVTRISESPNQTSTELPDNITLGNDVTNQDGGTAQNSRSPTPTLKSPTSKGVRSLCFGSLLEF